MYFPFAISSKNSFLELFWRLDIFICHILYNFLHVVHVAASERGNILIWLKMDVWYHFQHYFSYIVVVSFISGVN